MYKYVSKYTDQWRRSYHLAKRFVLRKMLFDQFAACRKVVPPQSILLFSNSNSFIVFDCDIKYCKKKTTRFEANTEIGQQTSKDFYSLETAKPRSSGLQLTMLLHGGYIYSVLERALGKAYVYLEVKNRPIIADEKHDRELGKFFENFPILYKKC